MGKRNENLVQNKIRIKIKFKNASHTPQQMYMKNTKQMRKGEE